MLFYNKILKVEKYGTVQAVVGWNSIKKGQVICGDLCCFIETLNEKKSFYHTINAAIEYNKWKTKKEMYAKKGLHYCYEFNYSNPPNNNQTNQTPPIDNQNNQNQINQNIFILAEIE